MPEYIDTLVCDAIRPEANNKVTLLGLLGDAIFVPQIPTQLASLAILQRWKPNQNEAGQQFMFSFQVRFPGGGPGMDLPAQAVTAPVGPRPHMNIIIQIQGFPIARQGDYDFVTLINGQVRHTHTVFFGTPPAAQRPNLIGFNP